jgi:hypothetical protein
MSGKYGEAHEARRQLAEVEQRVVEQKVRVAQLERLGCDAEISRDILRQLEDTLRRMKNRRNLVPQAMTHDA